MKKYLVLYCIFPALCMAQSGGGFDMERLMGSAARNTQSSLLLTAEQMPLSDMVIPDLYIVGHGDIFSWSASTIDQSEKLAVVGPDGQIFLERYGVVDVGGKTLTEAYSLIRSTITSRKSDIVVQVILRKTRTVLITVEGSTLYRGTYSVPASMRISSLMNAVKSPSVLLKQAASMNETQMRPVPEGAVIEDIQRGINLALSPYARRNIIVNRRGVTLPVDLDRALVNGNSKLDPHLVEGDVIFVPPDATDAPMVSIGGAVSRQVEIPFRDGDKASVLLAACGGLLNTADLGRIELHCPGRVGSVALMIDDRNQIVGEDPLIAPGCVITVAVRAVAGNEESMAVVDVQGAVGQPGPVVIKHGVTRLSEAVNKAGGLLSNASTVLGYIVRPERKPYSSRDGRGDLYMRFQYSDLKLEDTLRYLLDQTYRIPYVSCDMDKALRQGSQDDDVLLHSGDIVVIPERPTRVYVYGQVVRPGYVDYVVGKQLNWYVSRAGGYASGARNDRARVVRGQARVWIESDEATIVKEGDEIYVPREPDVPAGLELQKYAAYSGIIAAVTFLLINMYTIFR